MLAKNDLISSQDIAVAIIISIPFGKMVIVDQNLLSDKKDFLIYLLGY